MKNRVITISREFGSGGRTIGKKVAEKLGIPCYDSELIQKIAEESGFAENYVKEAGEYAPGGRFYTDMKWGDARNYHIALDSGVLGIEKCADMIASLY